MFPYKSKRTIARRAKQAGLPPSSPLISSNFQIHPYVLSRGIPFLVLGAIVLEHFAVFCYERSVLNDREHNEDALNVH
jgi:hypothetical protein